jgi:hypothetical protein
MAADTVSVLQDRTALMHNRLLKACSALSPDHFAHICGPQAPPIGWHLWHIARFADRLQARLVALVEGVPGAERWRQEQLAVQWRVAPADFGVHETGMGQPHADAVRLVTVAGQAAVTGYARMVFEQLQTVVQQVTAEHLGQSYVGVLDYAADMATGRVWATEPQESSVVLDLVMHIDHGNRHLGAIEGLRGLFGSTGSVSV